MRERIYHMKKCRIWMLVILIGICSYAKQGGAVTFASLIDFPASTVATDAQSGNSIDYSYEHDLSELNAPGTLIHSAALELKHLGNQDLGPTAEIWYAFSGAGTFIGRLGESNSLARTDRWELPQGVLDEITAENLWKLKIGLSEQTSFNGERLTLVQSKLEIDYTPPSRNIPTTPEPSSLFLMAAGILIVIRRYDKTNRC